MLRPGHIRLAKDQAIQTERAASYARKQAWKELNGYRYTAEELRAMEGEFANCAMRRHKRRTMYIA